MRVLITGVAGFIGFSLANYLINNKKNVKVSGIDNYDNYYSVSLKKKRIRILNKNKKFSFSKNDITKNEKLKKYFKNKKFDIVFHFAAQAGVRYSLINPKKYIDVNIYGFLNLINCIKKNKINKFIYASSSSVYGESKKFPLKEKGPTSPKNIYGYSKLINEKIADYYSRIYNINSIGLRFFTVFGSWGRPDMFILKLLNKNKNNQVFQLNNSGVHYRDFTSITDIVKILEKLSRKKIAKHSVFNICANRPIFIKSLIQMLRKYKSPLKIKNIPRNKADVFKTHGDNSKIVKYLNIKNFSRFEDELKKTIDWFDTQKSV